MAPAGGASFPRDEFLHLLDQVLVEAPKILLGLSLLRIDSIENSPRIRAEEGQSLALEERDQRHSPIPTDLGGSPKVELPPGMS